MTRLEQLPDRIDALASQILHLHTEMRAEFSAVRKEMTEQGAALRSDLITQMRVLHEDVIGRLALLQEGWGPPRRRPRRP